MLICARAARALVEVFKMAGHDKHARHCRPEKGFFKILEDGARVKRERIRTNKVERLLIILKDGARVKREGIRTNKVERLLIIKESHPDMRTRPIRSFQPMMKH